MKLIIQTIVTAILTIITSFIAFSNNPSDSVYVIYKSKRVAIQPSKNSENTTIKFKETNTNDSFYVTVGYKEKKSKSFEDILSEKLDTNSKHVFNTLKSKPSDDRNFIETSFFNTFDIGFVSSINDNENQYVINPKSSKSANINIGLFNQNMNLYKGQFLLSYGVNLNNYYLKYSDKQMVQKMDENDLLTKYTDTISIYSKNRQDIRYITVPVLLEFHSKKGKFSVAAGLEFGFNGNTHLKQKGVADNKDFKRKIDNEIKINKQQVNVVFKIGTENIAVFAKYALTDMYLNSAYSNGNQPHQHLMSFGLCLFGI